MKKQKVKQTRTMTNRDNPPKKRKKRTFGWVVGEFDPMGISPLQTLTSGYGKI